MTDTRLRDADTLQRAARMLADGGVVGELSLDPRAWSETIRSYLATQLYVTGLLLRLEARKDKEETDD